MVTTGSALFRSQENQEWEKIKPTHPSSFSLSKRDTWNFGGDPSGDGGPKALCCAGLDGEGVGGPWVQTHKEVVGFIPELEHFPPLAGEVSTWVQGANSLVVDLYNKPENKQINTFSLKKLDGAHMEEYQGRKGEVDQQVLLLRPAHLTDYPSLWIRPCGCSGASPSNRNRMRDTHMLFNFSSGHIKRKKCKKESNINLKILLNSIYAKYYPFNM